MAPPLLIHRGKVGVLMRDNLDTDQIIPSREMKAVSRTGLAAGLFAPLRYTEANGREPIEDFVLNRPEQAGTSVLVSGWNFGCGSSREHAVWALQEYGFRVIIAKSFGEIFYGNCLNNGILPVVLSESEIARLSERPALLIEVDLAHQQIRSEHLPRWAAQFDIGAYPKRLLMEGLDPVSLTLQDQARIDAFFVSDERARPWVYA